VLYVRALYFKTIYSLKLVAEVLFTKGFNAAIRDAFKVLHLEKYRIKTLTKGVL
jgi:hypothetical protein